MHVAAFAFVCIMIQASPDVILVNEQDEPIGTMEKMAAHQSPHLHRAFSIFLFDKQQRLLLQQRAHSKYHSAGLWTNTCCSHPYPGEPVADAAARRLKEEMGISVPVEKAFHFTYQASFDNGLYEYEFDHVFIGEIDDATIEPDPAEVAAYTFRSIEEINADMATSAHKYTEWFKIALPLVAQHLNANTPA